MGSHLETYLVMLKIWFENDFVWIDFPNHFSRFELYRNCFTMIYKCVCTLFFFSPCVVSMSGCLQLISIRWATTERKKKLALKWFFSVSLSFINTQIKHTNGAIVISSDYFTFKCLQNLRSKINGQYSRLWILTTQLKNFVV